jgi:uncharacterized tellurite resistance protein B-like protein
MIIYGTTGIKSVVKRGDFYCPNCNILHNYKHRKVVKWATLYFIPIFPMERVGEYIECQKCFGTWETTVLSFDPLWEQKLMINYHNAFITSLYAVVKSKGYIDPEKKQQALTEFSQFVGKQISMEQLDESFKQIPDDPKDLENIMSLVTGHLNETGNSIILKSAIRVAGSNGGFADSDISLISKIAEQLNISEDEFRKILAEVKSEKQNATI